MKARRAGRRGFGVGGAVGRSGKHGAAGCTGGRRDYTHAPRQQTDAPAGPPAGSRRHFRCGIHGASGDCCGAGRHRGPRQRQARPLQEQGPPSLRGCTPCRCLSGKAAPDPHPAPPPPAPYPEPPSLPRPTGWLARSPLASPPPRHLSLLPGVYSSERSCSAERQAGQRAQHAHHNAPVAAAGGWEPTCCVGSRLGADVPNHLVEGAAVPRGRKVRGRCITYMRERVTC